MCVCVCVCVCSGRRRWWWWSEHRALSFPEGGPADWKPEHSGPQPSGTGLPSGLCNRREGLGLPVLGPLGLGSQPWSPKPPPALNSICSAHCPHCAPQSRGYRHPSCLPFLSACPQCPSGGLAISHRAGWTQGPGVHQWKAGGGGHQLLPVDSLVASFTLCPPCPLQSCQDHWRPHL